ncbi:hypothetical protein VDGD_21454 [Verticillium dahliae]|nr:hypothetical protein VDGD_21454 [Verticillium dahliae]
MRSSLSLSTFQCLTFSLPLLTSHSTNSADPGLLRLRLLHRRQQAPRHLAGVLGHEGVHDDNGGHALDNGDGAGHDAGIVPALGGEDAALLAIVGGRRLVLANGGGGLEGDAEVDGGAVGDAALDAAAKVGLGRELGARDAEAGRLGGGAGVVLGGADKGVVVRRARDLAAGKARSDLEALGGWDAEHGVGEQGLELVEAGLAEAGGRVLDDAGDGAADRVVTVAEAGNVVVHGLGRLGVWAAHGQELVDGGAVDGLQEREEGGVRRGRGVLRGRREEVDVADARREGRDLGAVGLAQVLFGNGAGGDAGNGLARRGAAASGGSLDAVLGEVGPVGVRGTRETVHRLVAVILGTLVLVGHEHAKRCAQGVAKLGAGLDGDAVLLIAGCCDGRLAGPATCKLGLNVGLVEGEARGHPIDNDADGFAVGLAVAGKPLSAPCVWRRRGRPCKMSSLSIDSRGDLEVGSESRHDDSDVCWCVGREMKKKKRGEEDERDGGRGVQGRDSTKIQQWQQQLVMVVRFPLGGAVKPIAAGEGSAPVQRWAR